MSDSDLAARIGECAVPLETTDPGSGVEDLESLREFFEGRRVVGLGEATHGTREFFQLKHRLLEFLVTEMDYRLFAMEAAFSETLAIDDYVVHGEGDPREAIDGIHFWTWDTEEVLALVEWLREFNADRPVDDRVRFYGVDAQHTIGPARAVEAYLDRVDPGALDGVDDALTRLKAGIEPYQMDDDELEEALATTAPVVEELVDRLERRRDEYVADTSESEWRLASRHAWVLERAQTLATETHEADDLSGWAVRERSMADNVEWVLDFEDADRMALWAHNAHVARGERDLGTGERGLGQYLDDRYGDEYYALGFEFGRGSFQALPDGDLDETGLQAWTFDAPPENSLTETFAGTGKSIAYLDFEAAREDPHLAEWLEREHRRRDLGAIYYADDEEMMAEDVPADRFDALLYVDETTRAVPIDRDDGG